MRDEDTFDVNWAYVRQQAREALRIYFAPLVWLWRLPGRSYYWWHERRRENNDGTATD